MDKVLRLTWELNLLQSCSRHCTWLANTWSCPLAWDRSTRVQSAFPYMANAKCTVVHGEKVQLSQKTRCFSYLGMLNISYGLFCSSGERNRGGECIVAATGGWFILGKPWTKSPATDHPIPLVSQTEQRSGGGGGGRSVEEEEGNKIQVAKVIKL